MAPGGLGPRILKVIIRNDAMKEEYVAIVWRRGEWDTDTAQPPRDLRWAGVSPGLGR